MQGMDAEQGSNDKAASGHSSCASQKDKQKDRIDDVQNDICQMIARGPKVKHLKVQHVRKPCERMPVSSLASRKRPLDVPPIETSLDVRIFQDVNWIIKIDEAVVDRGPERYSYYNNQAGYANESDTSRAHVCFVLSINAST